MKIQILCLCFFLELGQPAMIQNSPWDAYDFSTVDQALEQQGQEDISFEDLVNMLISGESYSSEEIWEAVGRLLLQTVEENRQGLFFVICLTVFSVLFVKFTSGKAFGQVSQTGKYVTYLLLVTTLAQAVGSAAEYVRQVLTNLCNFLTAFLPTYFLSVSFTSGATAASTYYSLMSVLLWVVEWGILHVLLPVVLFYMVLVFLNYLSEKDFLTKFSELLETLINWVLKGGISLLLGLQVIQGMIAPYIGGAGVNSVKKVLSMIPGAGSSFSGAAELVLGAGMVAKNSIGAAGMIMLVVILAIPFLQLVFLSLLYHFTAAVIQPLGEERFTECVSMTAKGISMMMKLTGYAGLLFFLSLALMSQFTNVNL